MVWVAEWELPVAAILVKDLVFDRKIGVCLGPAVWESQPWIKESWCDPRWIIQSCCKHRALLPLKIQNHSSRSLKSPPQSTSLCCTLGTSLGPAAGATAVNLILSHLNRVCPYQNCQWMKRREVNEGRWLNGIQNDARLLPDWSSHRVLTESQRCLPAYWRWCQTLVRIHPTRTYAGTKCNLTTHPRAQKDGPDLIGSKSLLGYVMHEGKRARLSVLPAHGLFCE